MRTLSYYIHLLKKYYFYFFKVLYLKPYEDISLVKDEIEESWNLFFDECVKNVWCSEDILKKLKNDVSCVIVDNSEEDSSEYKYNINEAHLTLKDMQATIDDVQIILRQNLPNFEALVDKHKIDIFNEQHKNNLI